MLLRLLSLPPGHSAEGATDGAQRVVSDLDEHDPELARHLRAASGGPQQLRALLAARVDVYLTSVLPLDALLFAWDHCLLDGWRDELPRFLGDALGLLRDQLLSATTPAELELVLRDAPRALRTCDVRDAHSLVHPSDAVYPSSTRSIVSSRARAVADTSRRETSRGAEKKRSSI